MTKTKEEMDAMIKNMVAAKCSVLGCEEIQMMYMGLPSSMGKGIQEQYPFCQEHCMKIIMHEISPLRLKNGNVYGQEKKKGDTHG
jgi:hypothetical protein